MPTAAWHSAHIYYYELDKDALILDAVRPLLDELRPAVDRAYVVRHWRRGPHLRLHVHTDPESWRDVVRPTVERTVGGYLRSHPSTSQLDERAELPTHRMLADYEQESGPLSPWFPDNSLQYPPYDARVEVLGNRDVAELVADHAAAGTALLFEMLEHARSGADSKELLSLGLMLAASHTVAPPIEHAFISYRSHAEGFLFCSKDPDGTRARFDAHYRERRDVLTGRVRDVIATLEGTPDGEPVPFVREWADIARRFARRAAALVREDRLFPRVGAPTADGPPRTDFHNLMFNSARYREEVFNAHYFQLYRFALNNTYLQISRMGLTPYERLRTCHVAANAVEEVYGVSAFDLVAGFVGEAV
ncbi:thiopeptide maturation pyridine synthase [Pseudonocardia cypriaca]|uniref:Lantibiotic biosynthesis dehydratase-like protein n=1 Tax=Pseudonocardia cypriaca TaxID=882449 RepID=A0A543FMX9_9PSEU|nr:thiopeptide maturation pyridine synthase [Pseudonocardia cypriaca]TQM35034.1 lantibiotic biosynthesis dehydratase-like protein [Pseudonocardia cypriaca]